MQIVSKIKPLIIVAILFLFWKSTPLGGFPARFIKAESFVDVYELFFFPILLLLSFVLERKIREMKILKCLWISILVGYSASLISVLGAQIILSAKVSDVFYWINVAPRMEGYLLVLILPLPTLGWLLTTVDFFLLRYDPKKVTSQLT